jgi:hypothetical protein
MSAVRDATVSVPLSIVTVPSTDEVRPTASVVPIDASSSPIR